MPEDGWTELPAYPPSTGISLATISPLPYPCTEMAIHAHKHGDESNDRLQQRFKGQVQKTGILRMLRERSRRRRAPSKRAIRIRALKREEYRAINRKKRFYSNM